MRIEADLERCVGSGMCALTAADLFDQDDDDGHVVLLVERPSPERLAAAREAVEACPAVALSLHDDGSE